MTNSPQAQNPQSSENPNQESNEENHLRDEDFSSLLDMYRAQILVPEKKVGRQYFLCPIGLVGSGKTTVIKPLSERLQLARISTDEIRKLLKEQGYNLVRTAELAYTLIREFAKNGFNIAIDADCADPSVTTKILQMADELHALTVWIHINPPEEFIVRKLRNYQHTWLFKDSEEALASYFRRKPLHEKLDLPFTYTFDTSKPNLSQQIDESLVIIHRLVKS